MTDKDRFADNYMKRKGVIIIDVDFNKFKDLEEIKNFIDNLIISEKFFKESDIDV